MSRLYFHKNLHKWLEFDRFMVFDPAPNFCALLYTILLPADDQFENG